MWGWFNYYNLYSKICTKLKIWNKVNGIDFLKFCIDVKKKKDIIKLLDFYLLYFFLVLFIAIK